MCIGGWVHVHAGPLQCKREHVANGGFVFNDQYHSLNFVHAGFPESPLLHHCYCTIIRLHMTER